MREPVFTETMQIGIVVRDLAATMQRYVDDYGIGPWDIVEFHPDEAPDLHEHGKPVGRSWRLASTIDRPGAVGADRAARRRERVRTLPRREGRGCPSHRRRSIEL